jgi:ubiquinol-cytochrome c reductase cytochrome b subunit
MKKLIALLSLLFPLAAFAAGGSGYPLDKIDLDLRDQASLQSGAKFYMNYCMGCHSLQYERYERMVTGLGIPDDLVEQHLMFDKSVKIGDLMENSMKDENAKLWFGVVPPDLTLVARTRSPEWLYTYLRTFYKDPTRPYGVNNKVFPDVGMPHVLLELQGLQECAPGPVLAANGGVRRDPLTGAELLHGEDGKPLNPCGRLAVTTPGKMTVEEYDKAIYDLVNFLEYVAEPMQLDRQRIGIYVLLFLSLLFVFAWLLNREYWKDVHR